jgi:hypothetical protein
MSTSPSVSGYLGRLSFNDLLFALHLMIQGITFEDNIYSWNKDGCLLGCYAV